MRRFDALYRSLCLAVDTSKGTIRAQVPQIFGDTVILIRDSAGSLPTPGSRGWVGFEGGQAERPVWVGANVLVGEPDVGGGGGGGVTHHGNLTGLLNDDHPQYLTPARGDALFLRPVEVLAGRNVDVDYPVDGTVVINAEGGGAGVTEGTEVPPDIEPGSFFFDLDCEPTGGGGVDPPAFVGPRGSRPQEAMFGHEALSKDVGYNITETGTLQVIRQKGQGFAVWEHDPDTDSYRMLHDVNVPGSAVAWHFPVASALITQREDNSIGVQYRHATAPASTGWTAYNDGQLDAIIRHNGLFRVWQRDAAGTGFDNIASMQWGAVSFSHRVTAGELFAVGALDTQNWLRARVGIHLGNSAISGGAGPILRPEGGVDGVLGITDAAQSTHGRLVTGTLHAFTNATLAGWTIVNSDLQTQGRVALTGWSDGRLFLNFNNGFGAAMEIASGNELRVSSQGTMKIRTGPGASNVIADNIGTSDGAGSPWNVGGILAMGNQGNVTKIAFHTPGIAPQMLGFNMGGETFLFVNNPNTAMIPIRAQAFHVVLGRSADEAVVARSAFDALGALTGVQVVETSRRVSRTVDEGIQYPDPDLLPMPEPPKAPMAMYSDAANLAASEGQLRSAVDQWRQQVAWTEAENARRVAEVESLRALARANLDGDPTRMAMRHYQSRNLRIDPSTLPEFMRAPRSGYLAGESSNSVIYDSYDVAEVLALALSAVQQLSAKVTTLESRLAALEA